MTTPDVNPAPARLSPEEVAAMSDEELSDRVAVVVLGHAVVTPSAPDWHFARSAGGVVWWRHPTRRRGRGRAVDAFSPSNPDAVEHVREHMRERWKARKWTWCMLETEYGTGLMWAVSVLSAEGWHVAFATDPVFGRAIFQAALLAAQEMQPPVSQATPDNEMEDAG